MTRLGREVLIAMAVYLTVCMLAGCADERGPVIVGETESAVVTPRCVNFTFTDGFVGTVCLSTPVNWYQQVYLSGEDPVFNHGQIVHVDTGFGAAAWVCDNAEPAGFTQAPYVPCWSGGTDYSSQRVRGTRTSAGEYNPTSKNVAIVNGHYGRSAVVSRGWLTGVGMQSCTYPGGWTNNPPYNSAACGTESDYTGLPNWTEDYGAAAKVSGTYPSGNNGAPCMGYGGDGNYATVVYACPVYP